MSAEKTPTTETPTGTVNASTAIARYEPLESAIAAFLDKHKNVVHDVTTTAGLAAAKHDRAECRGLRIRIEEARVAEKADALAYGRKVDAEAKRLTGIISPAEDGYDAQIKREEQRKEAERQARIESERRRVAAIRERIDSMKRRAAGALDLTAHEAEVELRGLIAIDPSKDPEAYAEYQAEAADAHAATVDFLRDLVEKKTRQEAEAADLARQRAELEQQRVAQEARDRADRERREREEAAEKAEREAREAKERKEREDAEAQRRDELRAEEARIADERRKLNEQREAQAAEQRRIDAERAEADQRRKDEEERRAAAKRDEEARAAAAREADEAKRLATERAQREEAERKTEAEHRAQQRAKDLAMYKRKTPLLTLLLIAGVVNDVEVDDEQARYVIGLICEANLPAPSPKALEAAEAAVRG
jgi:colicin import membrane protein